VARILPSALVFLLVSVSAVAAQVRIALPKRHYKSEEQIVGKLENKGPRSATICVQFGQWSPKGTDIESTPSPFFAEKNRDGKWEILLNGPDIGSNRQPVELEVGKSLEFPFRLNDHGTMRLRLDYWVGSRPKLDCSFPPKDVQHLRSITFSVE